MRISTDPAVWLAAICTLGLLSFLYKDNIYFKTVEAVFIGFGAAHALVLGYSQIIDLGFKPLFVKGDLLVLIPVVLGLALYTRYAKRYVWMSRVPIGFLYGLGAAVAIRGTIGSEVVFQIAATVIKPKSFNDWLIIIGVLSTICYFFFSFGKSPALRGAGRVGRWFMMIAFGASFSSTAMGRISILIDRLTFLWGTWLGMTPR